MDLGSYIGELDKYFVYLPQFLLAFMAAFLLTPFVGFFARKYGVLDKPPSEDDSADPERFRRLEKAARPLLGGLAVIIPFVLLSVFYVDFDLKFLSFFLGVVVLTVLGVMDDVKRLSWKVQLGIQMLVIILTIAMGIGISSINNPFNGSIDLDVWLYEISLGDRIVYLSLIGHGIYIIWVTMTINAIKWSGGVDGLVEGIVGISLLLFFLISVREFDGNVASISAILLGAIVAFLFFNLHPSKIFSGSAGKTVYGFVLAVLAVLSEAKFVFALFVLALPIVDMLWVMARRFVRSTDPSILGKVRDSMKADNRHFHHQLLKLGLKENEVAYVEYLITLFLGSTAFFMTGSLRTVLVLIPILVALSVVVGIAIYNKKQK